VLLSRKAAARHPGDAQVKDACASSGMLPVTEPAVGGMRVMVDIERLSDEQLIARTSGRPEAFGVFYRRHEAAVLGFFQRRVRDPELAADLAAETFAAALTSSRRYRAADGPAVAWLFGIARHTLLRSLRRRRVEDRARRRLGMPPLPVSDGLLERIERLGADDRVANLLERLTPEQAGAVRARVIEEASYEEIAARLRCSESVVRQRVSRGLAVLRRVAEEQP
jgi:RNA polymerase sigma factor (sigma-70 family)